MSKRKNSGGEAATAEAEPQSRTEAADAGLPAAPPMPPTGPRKLPEWAKPRNPGKRFAIRTPNPGFNDTRHGVRFQEGVGFTDDPTLAEAFAGYGYAVEDTQGAE
jgi:hypothetical protein